MVVHLVVFEAVYRVLVATAVVVAVGVPQAPVAPEAAEEARVVLVMAARRRVRVDAAQHGASFYVCAQRRKVPSVVVEYQLAVDTLIVGGRESWPNYLSMSLCCLLVGVGEES